MYVYIYIQYCRLFTSIHTFTSETAGNTVCQLSLHSVGHETTQAGPASASAGDGLPPARKPLRFC